MGSVETLRPLFRRDCAEFFKICEGGLPRELRLHQVAANGLQDSLGIEHLDDAALPKSVGSLRPFHRSLGCPQFTGFKRYSLLVRKLVLLVRTLGSGDQLKPALL
jgi:hypothetical protein